MQHCNEKCKNATFITEKNFQTNKMKILRNIHTNEEVISRYIELKVKAVNQEEASKLLLREHRFRSGDAKIS